MRDVLLHGAIIESGGGGGGGEHQQKEEKPQKDDRQSFLSWKAEVKKNPSLCSLQE